MRSPSLSSLPSFSHSAGVPVANNAMTWESLPQDLQRFRSGPDDRPQRVLCGDINMSINAAGVWFYEGSPIGRKELVKLFAGVLYRDDTGRHWLITPAEMARITVEDAPFVVNRLYHEGVGKEQTVVLITNIDKEYSLGPAYPLHITYRGESHGQGDSTTCEPRPYLQLDNRLQALIRRNVFYQLVELGESRVMDGQEYWGVWSMGSFHSLGQTDVG